MSAKLKNPVVGFPKEWGRFFERNPHWPQALGNLHQTLEKVFIRDAKIDKPSERIVFFMGRLCAEDFNEIFLLAANGYGFGSLKILRGLYERVVTTAYISQNESEAEQFLEYHFIHSGKLITHAETFFGNLEKYIDKEEILNIKSDFEKYKEKFQQTACKKCKTQRIMLSWSKLDIAAMAAKTQLDQLYFPGYYFPTIQSHATASSIVHRIKSSENGAVSFNEASQPEIADRALIIAHNLVVRLIDIQNDYFSLNISKDMELLLKDFKLVWGESAKS